MSIPMQREEYDVFRAVLLLYFGNARRERFVLRQTLKAMQLTDPFLRPEDTIESKILHWRSNLKGLQAATSHDFIARNSQPSALEPKLDLPLPCVLLTDVESHQLWSRRDKQSVRGQPLDGWKLFRERYPGAGGVISLSRVGLNETCDQALLEAGVQADWLMGHGEMLLLCRTDAGWKVDAKLHLWIS